MSNKYSAYGDAVMRDGGRRLESVWFWCSGVSRNADSRITGAGTLRIIRLVVAADVPAEFCSSVVREVQEFGLPVRIRTNLESETLEVQLSLKEQECEALRAEIARLKSTSGDPAGKLVG